MVVVTAQRTWGDHGPASARRASPCRTSPPVRSDRQTPDGSPTCSANSTRSRRRFSRIRCRSIHPVCNESMMSSSPRRASLLRRTICARHGSIGSPRRVLSLNTSWRASGAPRRALPRARRSSPAVRAKPSRRPGMLQPNSNASCKVRRPENGPQRRWRSTTGGNTPTASWMRIEESSLPQRRCSISRNELRGRLAAFHAKADSLGALEDGDVAMLYERARTALYTAPTDLGRRCRTRSRVSGRPVHPDRSSREASAVNCHREGCAGMIVDGYCNDCGLAPSSVERSLTAVLGASPARPPTTATGRPRTTATIATGGRLGGGLVHIPSVPARDPESAVMEKPTVAEHRRFCRRCDEPVGRTRGGRPGLTTGFCGACGTAFTFVAKLARGDIVGGQYDVAGCLAHGGLGWIYLARDRRVSDRWVVLKGLLDSTDEHALAAALAERRFLAEVEHANIVKIHNFVEHAGDGYIVMEYVNGVSLRSMLEARRLDNGGQPNPLPVDQAIAFCIEILPALGHLHDLGLLYCDFKPDNVIQCRGVSEADRPRRGLSEGRRDQPCVWHDRLSSARDRRQGPVDLVGFCSPWDERWPYSARTSAAIRRSIGIPCRRPPRSRSTPATSRCTRSSCEKSNGGKSRRSISNSPSRRDGRPAHWHLREVVAAQTGQPALGRSTAFAGPGRSSAKAADWRALPTPLVDPDDPGAGLILSLAAAEPDEVVHQLENERGIESRDRSLVGANAGRNQSPRRRERGAHRDRAGGSLGVARQLV